MVSEKIYEIDGNIVRLKSKPKNDSYFISEYIYLERPDLSEDDRDILIKIISETVSSYVPKEYYKANLLRNGRNRISNVYSIGEMLKIKRKNYLKRGIFMSALYNPPDMPLLNFDEIKCAYGTLAETPTVKTLLGLIGAIFAYFVGGIDGLVLTMIASGIVYAVVGNTPSKVKYSNLAIILLKRLQCFALPFVILALINMVFYACTLGNFFRLEYVAGLRVFVIIILIASNTLGAFQRIEENGYKIPVPIVATAKAIDQGLRTGFTTTLTNILNNVKKGKD